MKKSFGIYWHIFYCSTIAIFAYLYFSNIWDEGQFTNCRENSKLMYQSQQFIANQGRTHLEEIFRNAGQSGDTTFQQDVKASQDYYQNNDSLKMYIQDVSTQLWKYCGGSFSKEDPIRMLRYKYYFPYKNFFDDAKINEMKQNIYKFANERKRITHNLEEKYHSKLDFNPILSDSSFWDRLRKCSPSHALQKLEELNFNAELDGQNVLNCYLDKVSSFTHCYSCADPRFEIMTDQINVENQDYFEGYIKMVETSFLCQHRNITCYVDGKKVPYKDRQAYIKYKPKKKGKNTIKIKLCVHNPVTGDVSTINTERIFYAK